jgi:predicted metal-binding protein
MLKFPAPFPATVFVCTKKREKGHPKSCCHDRGSSQLREQLKEMIKQEGLESKVRVFKSGCLGVCEQGPAAMAFPNGDLLMGISADDLPGILKDIKPE